MKPSKVSAGSAGCALQSSSPFWRSPSSNSSTACSWLLLSSDFVSLLMLGLLELSQCTRLAEVTQSCWKGLALNALS